MGEAEDPTMRHAPQCKACGGEGYITKHKHVPGKADTETYQDACPICNREWVPMNEVTSKFRREHPMTRAARNSYNWGKGRSYGR